MCIEFIPYLIPITNSDQRHLCFTIHRHIITFKPDHNFSTLPWGESDSLANLKWLASCLPWSTWNAKSSTSPTLFYQLWCCLLIFHAFVYLSHVDVAVIWHVFYLLIIPSSAKESEIWVKICDMLNFFFNFFLVYIIK